MTAPAGRAARASACAQFFINGLAFATWGVQVPTFKRVYALDDAGLALAMLAAGFGALAATACAGALIGRHGARAVCVLAGPVVAAALAALLHWPGYGWALFGLFVFGLANSLFDVAMNAHAAEVETVCARPVMSGCHGFFSLGGLAGAALASVLATAGVAAAVQMAAVAGAVALAAWASVPAMLPDRPGAAGDLGPAFQRPHGALLALGVLAATGLVAEGVMYDWSVLYLHESLSAPPPLAALAYASFSLAMAAGRFAGDWARARFGAAPLLVASGSLAALAMLTALLLHRPAAALVGFAFVGLGISNVVPVLFAQASRVPGVAPARGIAAVAGVGYLGFLVGPPMIGGVAQVAGLPLALGLVAVFAALIALGARRALRSIGDAGPA